jgi:AhpD family alkylhydroperoxidase
MRLDYAKFAAPGLRSLGAIYQYVAKSGLPPALLDLVYLRVSLINGCAYCIDTHSRDLRAAGVPLQKVQLLSVWREAPEVYNEQERAALGWAEAVTLIADSRADDGDYAPVASAFSEQQIADLTLGIAMMNAYNRLAISFRRGVEHLQDA